MILLLVTGLSQFQMHKYHDVESIAQCVSDCALLLSCPWKIQSTFDCNFHTDMKVHIFWLEQEGPPSIFTAGPPAGE